MKLVLTDKDDTFVEDDEDHAAGALNEFEKLPGIYLLYYLTHIHFNVTYLIGFNCLQCSRYARLNSGAQRCQFNGCCHFKKAHIGKYTAKHVCPKIHVHNLDECPSGNKKAHIGEEKKKRKYNLVGDTGMIIFMICISSLLFAFIYFVRYWGSFERFFD